MLNFMNFEDHDKMQHSINNWRLSWLCYYKCSGDNPGVGVCLCLLDTYIPAMKTFHVKFVLNLIISLLLVKIVDWVVVVGILSYCLKVCHKRYTLLVTSGLFIFSSTFKVALPYPLNTTVEGAP